MLKKLILTLAAVAVVAAAGWLFLSGSIGRIAGVGKMSAEAWCSRQLLAIAADHLNPTLHFDKLVYTFPKTVQLTQVTLTQQGVAVISVDSITIEFAGIPRPGEPLVLQTLDLVKPTVRLIEQADGSMLGLTDLVKSAGGKVENDGGSTRLSDVLAIETIKLENGSLSYEPQAQPAMVLQPLTFALNRAPAGAGTAEPGWYAFQASSRLDPVADIETKSRLNLNNGDLDIESLTLDLSLTEAQYQVFTPNIQQLLREHRIVGTMKGSMNGVIGLNDLSRTSLGFHVTLDDAHAVLKGHDIPVKSLDLDGSYRKNVLDLPTLTAQAFQGTLDASVRFDYGAAGSPFETQLDGKNLKLQDAMHEEGKPNTDYTGDVTFTIKASGKSDDLPGSLTGGGNAAVTDGRMVIVELFRKVLKKKGEHRQTDSAKLTFELLGDRVHYTEVLILGNLVGIRGAGDHYYDGRLNFIVNAGAVERITGDLGMLGQIFQDIAGSLVKYQVTGTLSDTKVSVLPLGIGEKKEEPIARIIHEAPPPGTSNSNTGHDSWAPRQSFMNNPG